MTRCQAYEMYVAGYQFHVLNNLFMNHWGLQVTQHLQKAFRLQVEKGDKAEVEAAAASAEQSAV